MAFSDYGFLLERAKEARKNAYAPYSGFSVGAALLCADGSVYSGCNIENAAFSPTVCAERVAVFRAVEDGKRDFVAIAVAGGKSGEEPASECAPCGVCRQVLSEFCDSRKFMVILGDSAVFSLEELLPRGFSKKSLQK